MRVGAVAGAYQRHRNIVVGEQRGVTGIAARISRTIDHSCCTLLQIIRLRQQITEQRIERQEGRQVALVGFGFHGFGLVLLRRTTERHLRGDGLAQVLRHHFGAHRRPVGIGAQEYLALLLGLLQRRQQIRRHDAGLLRLGMELLVEVCVQAGGRLRADVFGIQTRLGRHDGHHQLHTVRLELVAHATDQGEVFGLDLLAVGHRIELFIGVQPLVLAEDHTWAAFVEHLEVQRGPDIGAQALDREFVVVVSLDGLGPLAVEQGHLLGAVEVAECGQGPDPQGQQQPQEQGDVEDA